MIVGKSFTFYFVFFAIILKNKNETLENIYLKNGIKILESEQIEIGIGEENKE